MPNRLAGSATPGGFVYNEESAASDLRELFICTPAGRDGEVNDSVLAAAAFMGIEEVYRVGGAQAVAAMAYGTASIPRADVICGPGNAYVMEAKRLEKPVLQTNLSGLELVNRGKVRDIYRVGEDLLGLPRARAKVADRQSLHGPKCSTGE
jgi:hypothetical protein